MKGLPDHRFVMNRHRDLLICLFLTSAVLLVYWNVQFFSFINYDDNLFVTKNNHVRSGLTLKGAAWAFSSFDPTGNWYPLTWISLMLDSSVYGVNAGGYHWTNLLLHIANTLLLFILLKRMTADPWQSCFVAAIFAIHPLHVESVAWIAARKDVLSGFFFMLTLLAYERYAANPGIMKYISVMAMLLLGLMSKPMLMTMPFVMMLLDFWPLQRISGSSPEEETDQAGQGQRPYSRKSINNLLMEKIPLLALVLIMVFITFLAQQKTGSIPSLAELPLQSRAANALNAFYCYMQKTFWPESMAVFYPYVGQWSWLQLVFIASVLTAISIIALAAYRRFPYLTVGWLWYTGTLVPVIGLIQIGSQSMADRYTYIPLIGLFMMVSWGAGNLAEKRESLKKPAAMIAGATIMIFMLLSFRQVQYWRDSSSLFEHAIRVTKGNYLAHGNLGVALMNEGKFEDALVHFHAYKKIRPGEAGNYYNMGVALLRTGRYDEAISHFQKAVKIKPDYADAHAGIGETYLAMARIKEAEIKFRDALKFDPAKMGALNNLINALIQQGRIDEAISLCRKALKDAPNSADTYNNLGVALALKGDIQEAVKQFDTALKIKPDFPMARANLSKLMGGGKKSEH